MREIRCQFAVLARKDEPTPDYVRKDEPTPDYVGGNPVSVHHSGGNPVSGNPVSVHHSGRNPVSVHHSGTKSGVYHEEIRCQFTILARKDDTDTGFTRWRETGIKLITLGNPVSVHHSGEVNPVSVHHSGKKCSIIHHSEKSGVSSSFWKKSGVSSSFLPEKMNRHRITWGEIRCQFIILGEI